MELLSSGLSDVPGESDSVDQPWHVLKLRRTRWLDLFDGRDRVEAFEGAWRVFHYLMRKDDNGKA